MPARCIGGGVAVKDSTRELVEFFRKTKLTDIPPSVIETAKFAVMDSLGSAFAACRTDAGRILCECISQASDGKCTVIGRGSKASLMEACWVNASLAQVLDFDDTYEINSIGVSHPGPAVVPAAIAVCEKAGQSGDELLRAVVLGYEAAIRVAEAIEPRRDEFWGFANTQIMGAVTAASLLFELDSEQFVNAVGIAAASSPVPNTNMMWSITKRPMSWVKDAVGCAAASGAMSAIMAKRGFKGTRNGLDDIDGYYLLCGSRVYHEDKITGRLGELFKLQELSFKPYPTCRFMQSTLDSVSVIMKEHSLRKNDIVSIEVYVTPFLAEAFNVYEPPTMIDAQFSMPYAIAQIICGRTPSPDWYSPEAMSDPEIIRNARKVRLIPDSDVERLRVEQSILSPKVRVRTESGAQYEQQEYCAKGHPKKPFEREDFISKFKNCVGTNLSSGTVDKIVEGLEQIEMCEDISELLALLQATGGEER